MRVVEVVVVYDVGCPNCSQIARELPDCLRVPVKVRSCRDPQLTRTYPSLRSRTWATGCRAPAIGTVRPDGSVRWWPGLTGAVGLAPVLRWRSAREAIGLLRDAFRTARAR
ncbi:hypothetical protein ACVGVM_07665 [Pseudonocardia bannensis]|uniref:Uncharacterized protein n=1 Tax=Pseudonocardia bannensis TaxID=630973 RepID=A0A848DSD3_9PSEU|nr:hypothetical protein [Pseudonocardia bannensis]NMH95144.1 hypothetical protein [Pseudonocardia bannensis]